MSNFTFYTPDNSDGVRKKTLQDIHGKYGFIPNLFAYMAEAPHIIEAYTILSDLLGKTDLTPAQQQITLLAVSHYHNCDFCRVAHHAFGKAMKAKSQSINAILNDGEIEDVQDKALVNMVISMVKNRGVISDNQVQDFLLVGFERKHIYDLILIISIKTISNYSNHLTDPEANPELLSMTKQQ